MKHLFGMVSISEPPILKNKKIIVEYWPFDSSGTFLTIFAGSPVGMGFMIKPLIHSLGVLLIDFVADSGLFQGDTGYHAGRVLCRRILHIFRIHRFIQKRLKGEKIDIQIRG